MLKRKLRSTYKIRRKSISDDLLSNESLRIANVVLRLPIWQYQYYHIFLPISHQKEIDTHFILSMLQGRDKNVLVPKVIENGELKHYLLTDATTFSMNAWQIPEPIDGIEISARSIDVVFVPLLAFDVKGNRVGYGKGFYDKFLADCRKDVIKVGLSIFEADDSIDDIDEFDIPLDFCVTPEKIYSFSVRET